MVSQDYTALTSVISGNIFALTELASYIAMPLMLEDSRTEEDSATLLALAQTPFSGTELAVLLPLASLHYFLQQLGQRLFVSSPQEISLSTCIGTVLSCQLVQSLSIQELIAMESGNTANILAQEELQC